MGVAGLWDILRPAAKTRSLTDLAITEGFEANPDGKRGFRLGIDASIWFFHAEYGREGENPVLRTLFFRCATLMHTTFLPIFVFDGPKRPEVKRGKKINRTGHKLIPGMKQIVEAFGFEWRMAPGEAEAELAYLNRIGVIDGILSDDVDNFLFGATTVIRNSSNTLSGNRANPVLNSAGKDDRNHTRVFRLQDISEHPDIRLSRGGMILIGLMSGGDYQQGGIARCGTTTSHGLAKCGFGDSLYEAATNLNRQQLSEFLVAWRHELRQELRTNSKREIGRKQVALANSIPEDFPDIDILLSYVNPITSESMGRESNNVKLTWSKEPDLAKIAAACEFYFEWGYKEAIIKRFRTVMWHSIVLRILRRAVLDLDGKPGATVPSTPGKKDKATNDCGTPSKMIAQHFSSLALATTSTVDVAVEEEDEEERLIIGIHSSRTHTSTDGLLEYRLEIAPKQLVKLTESGIQGTRLPEGPDEWATEDENDEEGGSKKRGKGQPIDPETHLRLWMPGCMVKLAEPRLVQEYEDIQEQKRLKKAKKGTRSVAATEKPPKKGKKSAAAQPVDDPEDMFASPTPEKPKKKSKAAPKQRVVDASDEDDGLSEAANLLSRLRIDTDELKDGHASISSPIVSKTGIKDLTKKKPFTSASIGVPNKDLKSFFSVTHSLSNISSKTHNSAQSTSRVLSSITEASNNSTKGGITQPKRTSASKVLRESDDAPCDEYNPALWNKKPTLPSTRLPSPSKMRAHGKGLSSDSEPHDRLKKPPVRKNVEQTSSNNTYRSVSPSPSRSRRPVIKKVFDEVIEIFTDSEPDEPLSKQKETIRALPPLLAARERFKTTSAFSENSSSKSMASSKQILRTKVAGTSPPDIIDLT